RGRAPRALQGREVRAVRGGARRVTPSSARRAAAGSGPPRGFTRPPPGGLFLSVPAALLRSVPASDSSEALHPQAHFRLAPAVVPLLDVVAHALAQALRVERVHTAGAGEIERMRGGHAHGDARPHDAHARERRGIGIDAAPGGSDVVALDRKQTPQRDVVHVVLVEYDPVMPVA